MKQLMLSAILALGLSCTTFASNDPLPTVDYVELERYLGKWYELERLPNSFEKGCGNVTADYSLRKNGSINVINTCFKKKKNGKIKKKVAKGIAFVENEETNATLNVSFVPLLRYFGWFPGDYNIIALGDNYDYALVGSKNRKYLWILSRTKTLPEEVLTELKNIATDNGFDVSKLIKTPVFFK